MDRPWWFGMAMEDVLGLTSVKQEGVKEVTTRELGWSSRLARRISMTRNLDV